MSHVSWGALASSVLPAVTTLPHAKRRARSVLPTPSLRGAVLFPQRGRIVRPDGTRQKIGRGDAGHLLPSRRALVTTVVGFCVALLHPLARISRLSCTSHTVCGCGCTPARGENAARRTSSAGFRSGELGGCQNQYGRVRVLVRPPSAIAWQPLPAEIYTWSRRRGKDVGEHD